MKTLSRLMLFAILSGCMVDFARNNTTDSDSGGDTESQVETATCTYACMPETTCTHEFGGTIRGELTCAYENDVCCEPTQETDTGVDTVPDTNTDRAVDTASETGEDTGSGTGSGAHADTDSETIVDTAWDTAVDTESATGADTGADTSSGTDVDTGSDTILDTGSDTGIDTDWSTAQDLPIEEIIAQTYVLQNFEALLVTTKFSQDMQAPPYTIFAPWDSALEALPYWEKMTSDGAWAGHLRDLTLGHIHQGYLPYEDLKDGMTVTMLSGDVGLITVVSDRPRIDGFRFIGDTPASDGYLYLLQDVREPRWATRTILDIIESDEQFSILAQILNQPSMSAKREELMSATAELTFFAPTDEALAGFGVANCTDYDCLATLDLIVGNHLVGAVVPKLFTATQTFETQSGSLLDWYFDTQSVTCTRADDTLQETWLEKVDEEFASNGIVYPIDTLLCTTIN